VIHLTVQGCGISLKTIKKKLVKYLGESMEDSVLSLRNKEVNRRKVKEKYRYNKCIVN
jgi:hypothetical protein